MEPMKPMTPMSGFAKWWPGNFGEPSTSGAQNDHLYAFFPEKRRLLVECDGKLTTYDTGPHHISGVAQQQSQSRSLVFTSQDGAIDLDELKQVD